MLKSHENSSESRAADLPRLNDTEDSFEPPATQLVNLWPNVTNFDLFGAYVPEKKEILRWSKPLELEGALLFLSGFEAHSRCFGACIQPPKHRLWKMWPQGVCTMTSVMPRNVGRSSVGYIGIPQAMIPVTIGPWSSYNQPSLSNYCGDKQGAVPDPSYPTKTFMCNHFQLGIMEFCP